MNSNQLREQRANLAEQARAVADKYQTGEAWAAEDEAEFDCLHSEAENLRPRIERLERQEGLDAEMRASQGVIAGRQDSDGHTEPPEGRDEPQGRSQNSVDWEGFRQWLMTGMDSRGYPRRSYDIREAFLPQREARQLARQVREYRAMSTSATAGGETIPEDFRRVFETALLFFGGMRQARSTVLRTSSGAALPMPTADDTTNKGEILAENTKAAEQDIATGEVVLDAFKYTSKVIRVSFELLQDTAFDLSTWLAERLAERIGRITNEHFTTGTGSSQPNGVVTASANGATGAAGQTTSIIADDLIDLEHSVDIAYRMNAEWMLHDSTLKAIKKLKDADDRFLWLPGLAVREPDTILQHPFIVNNDIPEMAASAKSVLFGDFSKYTIRDVMDIQVIRLDEVYAEWAQVAFLAFSRHDADLLDAGTDPIKHYANAAT